MNKLLIISILVSLYSSTAFSQAGNVGIGTTTPDASAKLDINIASDAATVKKGLLIPQLNLPTTTDATLFAGLSPAGPAIGLLVYNTNSGITGIGANGVGFYYNSGTKAAPIWTRMLGNTNAWLTLGNDATTPSTAAIGTAVTAGSNFIGTTDNKHLIFATNNGTNTLERMRMTSTGNIGIGTITPTATALLTINPSTNGVRSGIDMTMTNAAASATGLKISAGNAFSRGVDYSNATATVPTSGALYGVGTELTGAVVASGNSGIVSGYLSYRNNTVSPDNKSYGLLAINGTNGAYSTNVNSWAAFLQGRTVISSALSPSSLVGTDLEVQNTTAAISTIATPNPANISLRQTNNILIANTPMTALNFGDSYVTTPQAQIGVIRDVTSSSAGDLPTALAFSTTPDASATLTERVRIDNAGNVGINTTPNLKLDINGAFASRPSSTTSVTADNTAITIGNSSYIKVTSDNANPTLRTITLSNGLQDGQYLIIQNTSASNPVELIDGANLKMGRSPSNLYGGVATLLMWNGTKWIEIRQVQQLPVKQVFTFTGAMQVFTVPSGVTKLSVKMWGAGGGPGFYSSTKYACGGSGGYIAGDLVVTPLENLLIRVGEGGNSTATGRTNSGYSWNLGGGAAGGASSPTDGDTGGGGGASSITRGSTVLAIVGGGGGAAGYPNNTATTQYGGAGGGTTGGNGGAGSSNASSNGKGGTAAAGGAGGTGSGTDGAAGISLQGGRGGDYLTSGYVAGGGGGGGYYGGGGGAGDESIYPSWDGGGGGGSSYTGGLSGTITNTQGNINTTAGTYASPPNTGDVDYLPGIGRTGYVTTSGGNIIYDGGPGLIVITW